jgi:hypothetical protein
MNKAISLAMVMSLCAVTLFAQAPERRVALVVGNGAYAANPLKNPPNDATDVAAALKDAGFEVTLLRDADLTGFEMAVSAFAASLKGADTGLFYYAGHGVAVDGMNYLIPVSPKIDDASSVKAKAVAVDSVVGKMEGSGVRTVLLFLDSCRDNPFSGASRSGTRGLAVVAAPTSVNSLIAYATSPGDVAQDGTGRNGVFSGAFLSQLNKPGQELGALMRNVKADVDKVTGGKQQPRVDDGMKEAFYFVSPEMLAVRSKLLAERSAAELVLLDKEIFERASAIAASQDESQKKVLEMEQQRQRALQMAKRLEAENLLKAANQKEMEALLAREQAAQLAKNKVENFKRQAELQDMANSRRAELEKLATAAMSNNPDLLINSIEKLTRSINEVVGEYVIVWQNTEANIKKSYNSSFDALNKAKPEAWESDAAFSTRIAQDRKNLESELKNTLILEKSTMDQVLASQTEAMKKQLSQSVQTLDTSVWTYQGKQLELKVEGFDRNRQLLKMVIGSTLPEFPLAGMLIEINYEGMVSEEIKALDEAVKTQSFTAIAQTRIARQSSGIYITYLESLKVVDLLRNQAVYQAKISAPIPLAEFTPGNRNRPKSLLALVKIDGSQALAFRVNGVEIPSGLGFVPSGILAIDVLGPDGYWYPADQRVSAGRSYELLLPPARDQRFDVYFPLHPIQFAAKTNNEDKQSSSYEFVGLGVGMGVASSLKTLYLFETMPLDIMMGLSVHAFMGFNSDDSIGRAIQGRFSLMGAVLEPLNEKHNWLWNALDLSIFGGPAYEFSNKGFTLDFGLKGSLQFYSIELFLSYKPETNQFYPGVTVGLSPVSYKHTFGTKGRVEPRPKPSDPGYSVSNLLDYKSKTDYKIGDRGPASGLVFYDKGYVSDGWRYLEAAPSDQSAEVQWNNGKNIDIKSGTAIGTGRANTDSIIAAQGTGSYAAAICDSLVIGSYDDWFLPSSDELNLMYTNLKKAGLGNFKDEDYWSSSQYPDRYIYDFVWTQYFKTGHRDADEKEYNNAIRAIRAF